MTTTPQSGIWCKIFSRNMLICIFIGFTSGSLLRSLVNLIPAWLHSEYIDSKTIGLMTLIGLSFIQKFIRSLVIDLIRSPFLGHRRGWMLVTQIDLLLTLLIYAFLNPTQHLYVIMGLSLVVAFFSVSQDIILDAFRREILSDEELGLGNSIHVNAYHIAALVPGSLGLILAGLTLWHNVFIVTALFMLPGLLMTLFLMKEPDIPPSVPRTFAQTVSDPFNKFFSRKGVEQITLVLLSISLYKLGDSMVTSLATPFCPDMGFSKTDIDLIVKNTGLRPAVVAGIAGGIWILKLGINRALRVFGMTQWVTILGFTWLVGFGKFEITILTEQMILAAVIGTKTAGVGLGMAAFVAYMAREANPVFTAAQLALFTSLSAASRIFTNASVSYLIEAVGCFSFYRLRFALDIFDMLLLSKVASWNG